MTTAVRFYRRVASWRPVPCWRRWRRRAPIAARFVGADTQRSQRVQRLALPPDELRPGGHQPREFLKIMGNRVGVDAVRHSAAAAVVAREHRRFRADVLPALRRAALLLLVHRRVHREVTVADAGRAGALRSDDHRLQSRRTCTRADHIRRVLQTFPGVFSGIGEFTHSQGIRLRRSRGRDRQPDRSGARPHSRFRRRSRTRRRSCTTTSTCRLRSRTPNPSTCADEGAPQAPPEATIIWAHVGLGRVVHPVQVQRKPRCGRRRSSRSSTRC